MFTKVSRKQSAYQILLLIGILFAAFNLRPAITSVGPIIGIIRDHVGMTNWSVGFLTTLPLIAFAFMSPLVPRLARFYSNERVLLWGLMILAVGIGIRSLSYMISLFLGTLLVGIGIAICNVLLPGIVKDKYPNKVGLMTSIYSTAMGLFAAIASGLSVPLAIGLDLGWQMTLLVWVIPAILGSFIWYYLSKKNREQNNMDIAFISSSKRMWRSPLAWQVACYMGLQSFLFYVTVSWLPEILHDITGMSMTTAGWMLSLLQLLGLPASFLIPVIAGRMRSQRSIVIMLAICSIGGFSGLLLGTSMWMTVLSIVLLGVTLGGTFALALSFLALRAKHADEAAELSGMAQSIGYLLAASGPVFIGFLHDVSDSWSVPLITMIIISILVLLFGLGAARDRYVFDDDSKLSTKGE